MTEQDHKPLRLAIAGLGTVGVGVLKILQKNGELIAARTGRAVEVTAVSARSRDKDRGVDLSAVAWEDDPVALAARDDVDVVLELIGGSDGAAKSLVEQALNNKKHVVTANKALIAHHGAALADIAVAKGVALNFEAAVAGGIPIVKALKESLQANDYGRVYGILNGTCNYILTEMEETGRGFADVLKDAQALGYAEADPSFDVGGIDAAHKLAILAGLAFGYDIDFDAVQVDGIEQITENDINLSKSLGYRIKLIGSTSLIDGALAQEVGPMLVPHGTPISDVSGVFNAVAVEGDFINQCFFEGPGAGEGPTASAVMGDVIDIARGLVTPPLGLVGGGRGPAKVADKDAHIGAFYVHLMLRDEPGGMAAVTNIFSDHDISIASMLQSERAEIAGDPVPVVLITHETTAARLNVAISAISGLKANAALPRVLPIATFGE